jgi:hypothetical protein
MQRGRTVVLGGADIGAFRDEVERDVTAAVLDGVRQRALSQSGTDDAETDCGKQ